MRRLRIEIHETCAHIVHYEYMTLAKRTFVLREAMISSFGPQ